MERPWWPAGPGFIELYWIALAVSLVFAILVRVRLRGTRGGAPAGALDIGLFDIAYLTGGPRRVVETSAAGLLSSGVLVPARSGAVRIAGSAVADDPVDQAVLTDVARYRNRTLSLLITTVSEHDAPRAIGWRLSEMDYLVAPERAKRWSRVGVVPLVLLLAVGFGRWVDGPAVASPVGWSTLQLVLTGVAVVLLLKVNPMTRTAKGRAAVAKARAGESTGGWGAAGSARDAELVALDGFDAHPNVVLRAAVRPQSIRRGRSAARAGGSYSAETYSVTGFACGSGSSCGGGSGCGGGGGS